MLAYLSRTNFAIKQIEKLSWDWIKMDCSGGKCYGLLAVCCSHFLIPAIANSMASDCFSSHQVHRFCFALAVFHLILSVSLIGVKSTKSKRAAIQNG
jgi:hypothetical protein